MTRNFPELLKNSTPELAIPPLDTTGDGNSRTASALFNADIRWRHLLHHQALSLHDHLTNMGNLAKYFCALDSSLSQSLDSRSW